MAMSKKDYQALARIFHGAFTSAVQDPHGMHLDGGIGLVLMQAVADYLQADNPRFNRALFLEACETGKCKGMKG